MFTSDSSLTCRWCERQKDFEKNIPLRLIQQVDETLMQQVVDLLIVNSFISINFHRQGR